AGILAVTVGAAEILAEAAGFELHFTAALIALQHRPFVALDAIGTLLQQVSGTVRVVATDMDFLALVEEIGIHRRAALGTALLVEQQAGFRLIVFVGFDRLVTWNQIPGDLAALLGGQGIPRTAEKYPGGAGADQHRPAAQFTGNIGLGGV